MAAWGAVLIAYEVHQLAQHRAQRTIDGRRLLLLSLARSTGKTPQQITSADLLSRMARGIAASSMQRERSDLQSFFGWAKEHKYVKKNPAKTLPKVTVPRGRPRPLTMGQVEAMLTSGAYRHTRTMILLGLYQGLRAHEIAKFKGEDIDLSSGTLRVIGKGGKDRTLPLHPIVRAEAERYPAGYWFPSRAGNSSGHIHYRSVSDLMTRAIRRAGITDPKITGHSIRHTFGTELVQAGVDIRVAQELLRHESLNSTQIYTGVSDVQKREGQMRIPVLAVPEQSGRLAA